MINFGINDVDETSENDDEVKNIPSVAKVIFESKGGKLENKFKSENSGENHVKHVKSVGVKIRLPVEFHRECDRVYHNKNENRIFERLWRHKPPNFVLNTILWDVSGMKTREMRNIILGKFTFKQIFGERIFNVPAERDSQTRKK